MPYLIYMKKVGTGSNQVPEGSIVITGDAYAGSTFTSNHNITDGDGLGPFSYQWNRSGAPIVGATDSTYQSVAADEFETLTVTISYLDGLGTEEFVTSNSIGPLLQGIVMTSGARTWSDETVAISAADYINDPGGKVYAGNTGSGMYRIDPEQNGQTIDVYCDMVTDGGGWMLIVGAGTQHGSTSTFWDGTLGSNDSFVYDGNALTTASSEQVISRVPFQDIRFKIEGIEDVFRSVNPASTFAAKKAATTGWFRISGDSGMTSIGWNITDRDGHTYADILLGGVGADAGYGDFTRYGLGTTSWAGTSFGTWFRWYDKPEVPNNNTYIGQHTLAHIGHRVAYDLVVENGLFVR